MGQIGVTVGLGAEGQAEAVRKPLADLGVLGPCCVEGELAGEDRRDGSWEGGERGDERVLLGWSREQSLRENAPGNQVVERGRGARTVGGAGAEAEADDVTEGRLLGGDGCSGGSEVGGERRQRPAPAAAARDGGHCTIGSLGSRGRLGTISCVFPFNISLCSAEIEQGSEPFDINHEHYHCQREVGIEQTHHLYKGRP